MKDAERLKPSPSQPGAADVAHLEREALAQAPQLFRLAARLLGNAAEAEDVLQEAFAKAISLLRAGAYRGDCALPTWLYRRGDEYRARQVAQCKAGAGGASTG